MEIHRLWLGPVVFVAALVAAAQLIQAPQPFMFVVALLGLSAERCRPGAATALPVGVALGSYLAPYLA